MGLAGRAYKNKLDAIESSNVQTMKQASSYFTEIVAAFAAMFCDREGSTRSCHRFWHRVLQAAFATSALMIRSCRMKNLLRKSKEDADEKLVSFLEKAVELSQQKGKEQPLLVIMAPPNCKAVDFFVIFCQDHNSFVAVQVKSNTLTEAKAQNEQKAALLQAAEEIRSASDSLQLVAFLAIVGSNYAETEDLKADTHFFCLQQEDLVALIPPFLRQLSGLAAGVQSVEGEDVWVEKDGKRIHFTDPKHLKHSVLPCAMQLHFAWLSTFCFFSTPRQVFSVLRFWNSNASGHALSFWIIETVASFCLA